ncbi:MAG: hypothetical protein ABI442_07635 [Gemmatimonadaceae bacterium]
MRIASTFGAAIVWLGLAASSAAQTRDSTHRASTRIIGVFDSRTGEPLAGVQVVDAVSGTYATTTSTGTARIDFIVFRGSAAIVELRKLGYEAKQLLIGTDTASVTETLVRVTELAAVVSIEHYRIDKDPGLRDGFATRCQQKSVTCFRDEDLLNKQNVNLADLLIRADGITIGSCGGGRGRWSAGRTGQCGRIAMRSSTIPPPFCSPTFFIDGIEWDPGLVEPIDLTPGQPAQAPFTPTNVKSIEVYPPGRTRPLRFSGNPNCGVVVIWTK